MVIDDVWFEFPEDLLKPLVPDVVLVEADGGVKVDLVASGKIVPHGHVMPRGAKAVGNMRANKARAPGDENTHPESLAIRVGTSSAGRSESPHRFACSMQ